MRAATKAETGRSRSSSVRSSGDEKCSTFVMAERAFWRTEALTAHRKTCMRTAKSEVPYSTRS